MERQRFLDLLSEGTEILGLSVQAQGQENLFRYFFELKRWSAKINLISRETRDEDVLEKHFLDSLALLKVIEPGRVQESGHLLDVGSGAGFPGLACRAVRPGLQASLLEPRLKRVSFLRHIVRTLHLDNVEVIDRRLEKGIELPEESTISLVVSRAVTGIAEFLGMCERFRTSGPRIVCMKGPRYPEELTAVKDIENPWSLEKVEEYRLPFSGALRALLVFRG